ncbi:MAG: alpha/beta hydrolase [Chloroflexota bacterium]|nr:alpha/beta hydrolase [Chloroflexota bacterium]
MSDADGSNILQAGAPLAAANAAAILIHGRGSSAADIIRLVPNIDPGGVAYLAPQAPGNSWYPHRFLVPVDQNEPHLSQALARIDTLLDQITAAGIGSEKTLLLGFSQGACLALEAAARSPRRLGAVAGLSGALIGPLEAERPPLSPAVTGLPVFLGCGDVDDHIPLPYLERTAELLRDAGAAVDLRVYQGMPHTINRDEVEAVRQQLAVLTGRLTRAD